MAKVQFPGAQHLEPSSKLAPSFTRVSSIADQIVGTQLTRHERDGDTENLIVISPYTELPHLLDLRTLEPQPALLARALSVLESTRLDYATAPYVETFNWESVIAKLRQLIKSTGLTWEEQKFFIVAFRSTVPPTTDYSNLGDLDKAAHAEAMASGGFLKYWFGEPNHLGQNLATCLWRTPADARAGGVGPAHRRAAGAAKSSYTEWRIERLGLTVKDGAEDWEIAEWSFGP